MGNICNKLKFSNDIYYYNFEDNTCDSYIEETFPYKMTHGKVIFRQKLKNKCT